ncbi:MAG: ROK family protein [Pseudomonadota bacterium]
MNIVVADIGGTKARLGLVDAHLNLKEVMDFPTSEFPHFTAILESYLFKLKLQPDAIGIGVAGAVQGDSVFMPNLGWTLNGPEIRASFKVKDVIFLNDLEAFAWGVETSERTSVLKPGNAVSGNRAVIASGTGLGMAVIHSHNGKFIPFATEGGHVSFAPRPGDEGLAAFISSKCDGHASWERVVSGKYGFSNLLEFLKKDFDSSHYEVFKRCPSESVGSEIGIQAHSGNPLAVAVMERFCYYYGAQSSNLALMSFAVGGVYLAGGVALKIKDFLTQKPWFVDGFLNKGRYREFLAPIPVLLLEDELCALRGSAKKVLYQLS